MFAGLDDIGWGAMEHAYGPADDIPMWVRGLVSPDPATREQSLDAMYGSVHHQGDVYECTLATVPFLLEALTTAGVEGRGGIAELLASIGGASVGEDDYDLGVDEETLHYVVENRDRTGRAATVVAASHRALLELAGDPDVAVRRALPKLLTLCVPQAREVTTALAARLPIEPDPEARLAIVAALPWIAIRSGGELAEEIVDRLLRLVDDAPSPSVAVGALIAAAGIDRNRLPDGLATIAVALLDRAYGEQSPPVTAAGFATDTLVGAIRLMTEERDASRRAPHASGLIRDVGEALGDRVTERVTMVTTLLQSAHADVAFDALIAASNLIEKWRGDYRETVTVVAGQIRHVDPRIADWATRRLACWGPVAAPAADALAAEAARLDALPRPDGWPAWLRPGGYDGPALAAAVESLAHLGDARALPMLLAALHGPSRPRNIGYHLARYPLHAPAIVAGIPPVLAIAADGAHGTVNRTGLLIALAACGPAAATAVPEILRAPLDRWAIQALGRIGAAASDAVPALRRALTDGDPHTVVAAAQALWQIESDASVVARLVAQVDGPAGAAALKGLATVGEAAADTTAYLATFLDAPDRTWWTPLQAATALWHVAHDANRAIPVLTAAWTGNDKTRTAVATCAADMGPAGSELAPLLRAELAETRRHGLSRTGWSSVQVADDESLLTACRDALAAIA